MSLLTQEIVRQKKGYNKVGDAVSAYTNSVHS